MEKKMWAVLLHLSMNMWEDYKRADGFGYSDQLEFDKDVWDHAVELMKEGGFNTLLIDLGNAVKYQSHPEIAVEGALSPEELKKELHRLRAMGITPIPKLNFSTTHDAWLGKYSKMVSSDTYYQVCKDLIEEVIEIFDSPSYFHLGMDEEDHVDQNNRKYNYVCYRNGDLFWHDLKFLLNCVFEKGVTPWIWADHFWWHKEEFIQHVPKEVMISPWYYHYFYMPVYTPQTEEYKIVRDSFKELERLGYRQVPAGSNYTYSYNMDELIHYGKETISEESLAGYMMTIWKGTTIENKYALYDGIHLSILAKKKYYPLDK